MTDLVVGRDTNSSWTYSRDLSDTVKAATLAADTDTTVVVPADMRVMLVGLSPGSSVIMKRGGSAITAPGATFVDRPLEDLNVPLFNVTAGETLHFFSVGDPAVVYLHFYRRGGEV